MNPSVQNTFGKGASRFEETLRLIASAPAPEGLEERVKAKLKAAPRQARVLSWPARTHRNSNWMRSAAAAAIVFVVVGGGWGVYSRVQTAAPARVIGMPPRVSAPGGFSSAGAMRTPQTLNGPVVTHAAQPPLAKNTSRVAAPHKTMRGSKAVARPTTAQSK